MALLTREQNFEGKENMFSFHIFSLPFIIYEIQKQEKT
jgi:hypothetical protein